MRYIKHFIVITKHKYFVMIECFKRGLYWQGIVHDLSKYSIMEFVQSARYFQGNRSPISKIKAELGCSTAWLHHKGRNKHHWEYWTDFFNGAIKPCKVPEKYLVEMACDMIGASKAYLKTEYDSKEPLAYFNKNSKNWCMLEEDKKYIETLLSEIIKEPAKEKTILNLVEEPNRSSVNVEKI
jgi:hypothetical protein